SEAGKGRYEHKRFLIIDSIGMLSQLYRFATLAYIGGGFGVGIHNILEAATYG
ncbi:MAG TPA: 3-deoxy-D-manno-octulosonic acid transferase, partial [Bacteroidales bacterium]|nr:3-deoxy-D-manno-octulosonic acid transferase [Bacteroidales bacterium]